MKLLTAQRIRITALLISLAGAVGALHVGCTSRARRVFVGGGYHAGTPVVTLVSAVPVADSPRGWPIAAVPMPYYPLGMVRAGISGEVTVRLKIGTDGIVTEASVVRSSQPEFEQPAINATKLWHFRPLSPIEGPKSATNVTLDCTLKFTFDES